MGAAGRKYSSKTFAIVAGARTESAWIAAPRSPRAVCRAGVPGVCQGCREERTRRDMARLLGRHGPRAGSLVGALAVALACRAGRGRAPLGSLQLSRGLAERWLVDRWGIA